MGGPFAYRVTGSDTIKTPDTDWCRQYSLPFGARIRLKASFDISGYSATNQIILRAMKKYGLILADIGSNLYITGAPDERWNNDDLRRLGQVHGSDFEVVKFN